MDDLRPQRRLPARQSTSAAGGEYLNPAGAADYDVSVSSGGPHGPVIFSTRSDGSSVLQGADASGGMFPPRWALAGPRPRRRFHEEAHSGALDDRRPPSRRFTRYRGVTGPHPKSVCIVDSGRTFGRNCLGTGALHGALPALVRHAVPLRGRRVARLAHSAHGDPRRRVQPGGGAGEGTGGGRPLLETHPSQCRRTHLDDRERAGVFRVPAFGDGGPLEGLRWAIFSNMPPPPWRRKSNRPAAGSK